MFMLDRPRRFVTRNRAHDFRRSPHENDSSVSADSQNSRRWSPARSATLVSCHATAKPFSPLQCRPMSVSNGETAPLLCAGRSGQWPAVWALRVSDSSATLWPLARRQRPRSRRSRRCRQPPRYAQLPPSSLSARMASSRRRRPPRWARERRLQAPRPAPSTFRAARQSSKSRSERGSRQSRTSSPAPRVRVTTRIRGVTRWMRLPGSGGQRD
jgi:hypothetical protein